MSPHAVSAAIEGRSFDLQNNPEKTRNAAGRDIPNGQSSTKNHDAASKSHLTRVMNNSPYDLVCVGFGPANLALAIAIQDAIDSNHAFPGLGSLRDRPPKVLFLERQKEFGWHKGMLLPGSKMQITFIKDLATFRNPRSEFTFLNYLHKKNRLASFTNLGTFLPQRLEFEDYMKWCAASFDDVVDYGKEVLEIRPDLELDNSLLSRVHQFKITVKDTESNITNSVLSKKVVLAVGGKPRIPESIPANHPKILHSAYYATHIHDCLRDRFANYTVAVVGCGQSAAEIFKDLRQRFPNCKSRLIIRGSALKPSDDSPFVNEIFDPEKVDEFFEKSPAEREASIAEDRATNYSVVRPHLLEELYEDLYMQQLETGLATSQHQILPNRHVSSAKDIDGLVRLSLLHSCSNNHTDPAKEVLDVDAVIFATGYSRDSHEALLEAISPFKEHHSANQKGWHVSRDYQVALDERLVKPDAGIWLTGCNESTHGLSDTLLSVLATRGGELTHSIFGG